ncbi:MAG: PQQ-binding-like beta-propeller repeat protein [Planctomycetota bacterium]
MSKHLFCLGFFCLVFCVARGATGLAGGESSVEERRVKLLTSQARGESGLCVHIGCGSGTLTAALARDGRWLVHGWEKDPALVSRARQTLATAGLYGQASVETGSPSRLPYGDNLVNLLVIDDLARVVNQGFSLQEIRRVLCPQGVALLGQAASPGLTEEKFRALLALAGIKDFKLITQDGFWARIDKPRPPEMDEWTHYRHGAEGSGVSNDRMGPLSSLRWLAGPAVGLVDASALVSAQGRNFYIMSGEYAGLFFHEKPAASRYLVARDAFNGLLRWMIPYSEKTYNLLRFPRCTVNFLVASGDRVFAIQDDQVVVLDAATGGLLKKLGPVGDSNNGRLLYDEGLLVVRGRTQIRCFDPVSGEEKWNYKTTDCQEAVLGAGQVVIADKKDLVRFDLKSGQKQWSREIGSWSGGRPALFYRNGHVFFASVKKEDASITVHAISFKDGASLWQQTYSGTEPILFFAKGLLWIQKDFKNEGGVKQVQWEGFDPNTGELRKSFVAPVPRPGCAVDGVSSATENFFLYGRPSNFMEWETGKLNVFSAVRNGCGVGGVVANGLYYGFPNRCMCVGEKEIRGFAAFAPDSPVEPEREEPGNASRMERGLGNEPVSVPATTPQADEWRTFRHDARRSASSTTALSTKLELLWEKRLDDQRAPGRLLTAEWAAHPSGADPLTAPVVAEGIVFTGLKDRHRVVACDAATGEIKWSYTAGGRLDMPPTIHQGLCLFGSRDGWVYCLKVSDGNLLWRFRAAPAERKLLAFGQIESCWPVAGGVLIENGVACVLAGRGSALSNGDVCLYGLEPGTGKLLWSGAGTIADLLVSGGAGISAGGLYGWFDPATGKDLGRKNTDTYGLGPGSQARTVGSLLDYSWHLKDGILDRFHFRRYAGLNCQLVAFDRERVYGFTKRQPQKVPIEAELQAKEIGKTIKDPALWKLPSGALQVESMAVAGEILCAAGPLRGNPEAKGELWLINGKDGRKLAALPLAAEPASEGLAVAQGRLYVSTRTGGLLCFGEKR